MSEIVRRRRIWYAVWIGGALWLARLSLAPAPIRGLQLTRLSGAGPYYALLSWSYGIGARPTSIIFDFAAGEVSGSATTDGEAIEAEIPLGAAPTGQYRLIVSATYRTLGFAYTRVTQVQGDGDRG
jgi:hypothetical protein